MSRFNAELSLSPEEKPSAGEIEKIVNRLKIQNGGNLKRIFSEDVRVAVTQVLLRDYRSLADYIIDMNLYVADAVNRRAQLVCFPAYAGLLPVSLLPMFDAALPWLRPVAADGMPDIEELNDILSYFSDAVFDIYMDTMSMLAARHGVYIMAGSTLYFEDNELLHRAFLFNHSGDIVGFQDKLTQNKLEHELETLTAPELKTFATPVGDVAILIGEDADLFEPARIAKSLGANILLNPNAYAGEHTAVNAAMGVNMRAQENFLYGVESVLVGSTQFGFTAAGAAHAFAPSVLITRKNGILTETSGKLEPGVACARLNLEAIERPGRYASDKNPELLKRYIDRLY